MKGQSMISGKIVIKYMEQPYTIRLDEQSTNVLIDDAFFRQCFEGHNLDEKFIDHDHFTLTVTSERDTLVVEDLTFFKKVSIRSFNDTKASFGLLVVNNIDVDIIGAFIDILRTASDCVFISRSLIRSYEYSLNECEACQISGNQAVQAERLELHYVTIEILTIYKSIENLIKKSAKLDRLEIDGILNNQFTFINITWNTFIEEFSIAGEIGRLRIKNSILNKMNFKKALVHQFDNKKSDINMVFMLETDKMVNKNQSAWELLFKSAVHDDNDALYARAGYEINHLRHKNNPKFTRISGQILNLTIGYGYRPYRAIIFSIVAISLFALIYLVLDHVYGGGNVLYNSFGQVVAHYFDMWYLSGTAYTTTGFGDVVPSNDMTKVLAIFEAMIGVSVLSLFMYSLLNRYGKK